MSGHWLSQQGRPDAAMASRGTPAKPRAGSGILSAVTYLVLGFLCGAVFWHFIGFWSTFHDIVLRGPVRNAAAEHRVAQWGPSCTSLALDRDSGVTRAEPCAASSVELTEAVSYRRDRLVDRHAAAPRPLTVDTRWTVIVKEPAAAPAVPPSVGSVDGLRLTAPN